MPRSDRGKRNTQKKRSGLSVFKSNQLLKQRSQVVKKFLGDKGGNQIGGSRRDSQNREVRKRGRWNRRRGPRTEGAGRQTKAIQPNELALGSIGEKAKRG